jgi:gamma-tubulin complex component 2
MQEYLTLVAQLEHQFLTNPDFTLQALQIHSRPTSQVLFQLHSLTYDILRRNSMVPDEDDEDLDNLDDVENILESLREGKNIASAVAGSRSRTCKGGIILGILAQRLSTLAGDISARTLLQSLLREASKPYMHMLNLWLHHGEIADPHGEFLIKEQKSIRKEKLDEDYTDEYWEKRYTVREGECPPQLEALKDKVLLAGKYLNVVRECGGIDVAKDKAMDVPLTFDDPRCAVRECVNDRFLDNINSAYSYANTSLLNLLITTHALPARLRSLKHYFFLDRSDFFTHFLDLASHELKKSSKLISLTKLQSLLDLCLRQPGSVAASDPFKEDVRVQMNDVALTDWLMRIVNVSGLGEDALSAGGAWIEESPVNLDKDDEKKPIIGTVPAFHLTVGVNALQLDYTVPFPLSLVISRKAVLRYQLLFRHLLALKHLEQLLGLAWLDHVKTPTWHNRSSNIRVEKWKSRVWALRSRMLVFIQQLSYFCTNEVIEPNWLNMQSKLEKITTVDELMRDHIDFLDTCLKECMLTNSKLIRVSSLWK